MVYADRGGGKSSVYISIGNWMVRTRSDRKIWLMDSNRSWDANRPEDGSLDGVVEAIYVDRESFGGDTGWLAQVKARRDQVRPDDWWVVDLQSEAWEGAQSYYWGQKSGNDSLAELWLRHSAQDIAGDHGINWGIIKKSYFEFTHAVTNLPCHVLLLASADVLREPNKAGKGGDDLDTRSYYGKVGYKMDGEKTLRGEGHTVIYAFEANGKYRYTTVKEMGPIGHAKREYLLNEDVTDKGFVGGYLMPIAGWRP